MSLFCNRVHQVVLLDLEPRILDIVNAAVAVRNLCSSNAMRLC